MRLIAFTIIALFVLNGLSNNKKVSKRPILMGMLEAEGILFPDVVAAQAILETADFTSNIFVSNNNMFGMKNRGSELEAGKKFGHAAYPGLSSSIKAYKEWQDVRFKQLTHCGSKIPATNLEYIQFLERYPIDFSCRNFGKYAEDPAYKEKLIVLLDRNKDIDPGIITDAKDKLLWLIRHMAGRLVEELM